MTQRDKRCETCLHFCFQKKPTVENSGECRIRAPIVAPINKAILNFENDDRNISAQNFETAFPQVTFNLWCSEWKEIPGPPSVMPTA